MSTFTTLLAGPIASNDTVIVLESEVPGDHEPRYFAILGGYVEREEVVGVRKHRAARNHDRKVWSVVRGINRPPIAHDAGTLVVEAVPTFSLAGQQGATVP